MMFIGPLLALIAMGAFLYWMISTSPIWDKEKDE